MDGGLTQCHNNTPENCDRPFEGYSFSEARSQLLILPEVASANWRLLPVVSRRSSGVLQLWAQHLEMLISIVVNLMLIHGDFKQQCSAS